MTTRSLGDMTNRERLSTSGSLETSAVWQKSIGHDPYKGADEGQGNTLPEVGEINSSAKGLFRLAQLTGNSSTLAPGSCKRCGQVGHLYFQCRNWMSAASLSGDKLNQPVPEVEEEDDDPEDDALPSDSGEDSPSSDSDSDSGSDDSDSDDSDDDSDDSSSSSGKKKKKKRKKPSKKDKKKAKKKKKVKKKDKKKDKKKAKKKRKT